MIRNFNPDFDEIFKQSDFKIKEMKNTSCLMYKSITGDVHRIDKLGTGIKSLLKIFVHLIIAERKGELLIIDEPESHLHPQAQKSLAKVLSEKSARQQIIICTHSSYFLNWQDF